MTEPKKVLLQVHMDAVQEMKERGSSPEVWSLLDKVAEARRNYDQVFSFEDDPWEPEWNPRDSSFSWTEIAEQLGADAIVEIAGVQTEFCVQKVHDELRRKGVNAKIAKELTWDSEFDR